MKTKDKADGEPAVLLNSVDTFPITYRNAANTDAGPIPILWGS